MSDVNVQKLAKMLQLELTDSEIEKLTFDLEAIIDYIKVLDELNLDTVEPTFSVTGLKNVYQDESAKMTFSQEEAVYNAKSTKEGLIIAKAVFGESDA
jgi:aspartyl-tRNA(Asn)/glutamyl-tRNA(Gln) amidotransferase subunit C